MEVDIQLESIQEVLINFQKLPWGCPIYHIIRGGWGTNAKRRLRIQHQFSTMKGPKRKRRSIRTTVLSGAESGLASHSLRVGALLLGPFLAYEKV